MMTDAKVRGSQASLEAHQRGIAAWDGRGSLATCGRCDLGPDHAWQEPSDSGLAAEIVLIAPEMRPLTGPAGDHVSIHFSCTRGGQENAAGAVADKVSNVHDGGAKEIVEHP